MLLALAVFALLSAGIATGQPIPAPPEPPQALTPAATAEWLQSNPQDPRWPELFRSFVEQAHDLALLLRAVERLPDPPRHVPADLALEIAGILDAAGRPAAALRFYEYAASVATAPEQRAAALLGSVVLACDLGASDKALRSIEDVMPLVQSGPRRAELQVLRALIRYDLGYRGEAVRDLQAVLGGLPPASPALLQALFALAAHYRVSVDADQAALYQRLLEASFPGSPEAALLRSGSPVSIALSPRRLFTPADLTQRPVPTPPAPQLPSAPPELAPQPGPPDQQSPPPARPLRIQAGSFTVRENATFMVADLAKAGFPTVVEQILLAGRTYYRVILNQAFPPDEVRTALIRLKEAGFEGAILP